jgi:hypothetical protein
VIEIIDEKQSLDLYFYILLLINNLLVLAFLITNLIKTSNKKNKKS